MNSKDFISALSFGTMVGIGIKIGTLFPTSFVIGIGIGALFQVAKHEKLGTSQGKVNDIQEASSVPEQPVEQPVEQP